jgi:hypothetical protein
LLSMVSSSDSILFELFKNNNPGYKQNKTNCYISISIKQITFVL